MKRLNRKLKSKEGSILIVSIILLFIMLTLGLSLITQEKINRNLFLSTSFDTNRDEAIQTALQCYLGTFQNNQYSSADFIQRLPTTGFYEFSTGSYKINCTFGDNNSIFNPPPAQYTAGRNPDNVPGVGYGQDLSERRTGYRDFPVPPWHSMIVLEDPNAKTSFKRYVAIFDSSFPYGVYAPNGSIYLKEAMGWANPTLTEQQALQEDAGKRIARRNSQVAGGRARRVWIRRTPSPQPVVLQDIYSGVPVNLYAKNNIIIKNFPYGKAYSVSGTVDVQGGGIGYSRISPDRDYGTKIAGLLRQAYSRLSQGTLDKSMHIYKKTLTPISFVNRNLNPGEQFTLEQAFEVPIGVTVMAIAHGNFCTICNRYYIIHSSYQPDGCPEPKTRNAETAFYQTYSNIAAPNASAQNKVVNDLFPKIKAYDDGMLLNRGNTQAQDNLTLNFAKNNLQTCRLIHFGESSLDHDTSSVFTPHRANPNANATGFDLRATWVVPRGRTLRLNGNVTLHGDLWIQEGATFYVTGHLVLQDPTPGQNTTSFLKPSGKLVMAPGAKLIVGGNLDFQGTRGFGSVYVTSPPGKISTITSSIMVNGNARIPYGIIPAVTIEDLARYYGATTYADTLKTLNALAPSIAKVSGPFHRRQSFFAPRAVVARVRSSWPPWGGWWGGFSIIQGFPENITQQQVVANKMASTVETESRAFETNLNALLGEYLFTHSDWWFFGEGVVPVIPKVDIQTSTDIKNTLNTLALINIPEVNAVSNFVTTHVSFLRQLQLNFISSTVPIQLGIINFRSSLALLSSMSGVDNVAVTALKNNYEPPFNTRINQFYNTLQSYRLNLINPVELLPNCTRKRNPGFRSVYRTAVDQLDNAAYTAYINKTTNLAAFNESPGILIYTIGDLNIGGYNYAVNPPQPTTPCYTASGFFVAERQLYINSRRVAGTLMSINGDVSAAESRFLAYPYFDRASLPVPQVIDKYADIQKIHETFSGSYQLGNPLDIDSCVYRIIFEGWDE